MLTITTAALDRLSNKLAGKNASEGEALRFNKREGGWRLQVDRARPDDTAFTLKGRKVLVLDSDVAGGMSKLTLDVRTTKSGPRLRLRRGTDGSE